MAVLESCPKHNMVAYLEKTEGNAEFHEVINFLARSSIHHALTVSPVVSTTFVEQFWMSAKSKMINNVRYITAKVAGKPVSISEASIRSDLLFDDADGIDSLPNQAIFDAIQLMGYEGDLTVSDQAKEIQRLKAHIKKLKKQAKPVITHHRAWMKSVSLKQRLAGKRSLKKIWVQKESVSKHGRKSAKGEPSVHNDSLFDEILEDTVDYMETEVAQDVGRSRDGVNEEMENADAEVSTEDVLSTAQEKVSTDTPKVSTDVSKVSTDKEKVSTDRTDEGNYQHSQLKTKKFEEIQALYEKIKRSDEDFIAIGSAKDERMIKEMNEKGIDSSKNESVKEEGKTIDDDSDDEHRKCLKIVTFEATLDSEIMEKKSVIARLAIYWYHLQMEDFLSIYRANGNI
ncbi:hypothetical protein Tco_1503367 [Tanacetum coccineum]